MKKPISKNDYSRFLHARTQTRYLAKSQSYEASFAAGFIRVFESRGLLSRDNIEKIKVIAKSGDVFDVRAFIEENLIEGMGE